MATKLKSKFSAKVTKKPVLKNHDKIKVVRQRQIGTISLTLTDKQAVDAGFEETDLTFVIREHATSPIHVEVVELDSKSGHGKEKMVITMGLLQALINMAKDNRG